MRRTGPSILLLALVAACGGPETSATPGATADASTPSASEAPSVAVPSPSASPSPAPTPLVAVAEPGRPYDADAVLAAMRESRRPGGVPDHLETPEVAAALADRIWTIGGAPWPMIAVAASCGIDSCLVEIGGTPDGAEGEDLYVFDVDTVNDQYALVEATLQGLAPDTVAALDRLARERSPVDLGEFLLASARWLPPPDEGEFVLAYRSGGEEGSPRIDVLVDVEAGTVTPLPEARLRGRASG